MTTVWDRHPAPWKQNPKMSQVISPYDLRHCEFTSDVFGFCFQKMHWMLVPDLKFCFEDFLARVNWGQNEVKPWHRWRLSLAWPFSLSKLDIWSSCFTFESSWSVESKTSSRKCFISPNVIPSQPEELKKSMKADTARTIGTLPIKPVRAFFRYYRKYFT